MNDTERIEAAYAIAQVLVWAKRWEELTRAAPCCDDETCVFHALRTAVNRYRGIEDAVHAQARLPVSEHIDLHEVRN